MIDVRRGWSREKGGLGIKQHKLYQLKIAQRTFTDYLDYSQLIHWFSQHVI